jgi:hypothetical protein
MEFDSKNLREKHYETGEEFSKRQTSNETYIVNDRYGKSIMDVSSPK